MGKITIIGDCHGHHSKMFYKIEKFGFEHVVQVGDLDFNYDFLKNVDPNKFCFIFGNHDGYYAFDETLKNGHNLGHFGTKEIDGVKFFFVRGGCSIDQADRTPGFDFFPEEELNLQQQTECFECYKEAKPDFVISHEGPAKVINQLFTNRSLLRYYGYKDDWNSNTGHFLQTLLEFHEPKLWTFGHFHEYRAKKIGNCMFYCIPELGSITIDSDLKVAP